MTRIEWTEATWNPIVGCSIATPGCTNCYAMRIAHRLGRNPATPHYAGLTQPSRGGPVWTGKLALAPDHVIKEPPRRRKPTTYFVNSMGDLFHEDVPDDWIDRVFTVMARSPQHRFQVLTKRADRMREYLSKFQPYLHPSSRVLVGAPKFDRVEAAGPPQPDYVTRGGVKPEKRPVGSPLFFPKRWPLPNVWLGVSVEDQARADLRIPDLLATPAAVRFISAEPLLGPVDLENIKNPNAKSEWDLIDAVTGAGHNSEYQYAGEFEFEALDWVIVGGESGRGARPMHRDWARDLRDQCQDAGAAFFFKQWGEWAPGPGFACPDHLPTQDWHHFDPECSARKVGKKAAGRLLDGREWNQMPEQGGAA